MKFEHTRVFNFDGAFRGMRNPMNSWNKSDSMFYTIPDEMYDPGLEDWIQERFEEAEMNPDDDYEREYFFENWYDKTQWYWGDQSDCHDVIAIGPGDMKLARNLINAGTPDRKFLREILVCVDITAPLYWWKEFDTYKVGTVANSTSTMHKLATTPITLDDFEISDLNLKEYPENAQRAELKYPIDPDFIQMALIPYLEYLRQQYLETKDVTYWKELIRWLPNGWLQTRTVTMSYENIRAMRAQRKHHKQTEWREDFINWSNKLPYAAELLG